MGDTSPESMAVYQKKALALELRLRKESFRSIAAQCGVSPATIINWVKEMTAHALPQDDLDTLRAQEVAGLDELERNAYGAIEMLQVQASRKLERSEPVNTELAEIGRWQEQIQSIKKQRATLVGMNIAPIVKHQINVRTDFDAEVEELVAHLTGGGDLLTGPEDIDTGEDLNV